jgi:hypothetical protein
MTSQNFILKKGFVLLLLFLMPGSGNGQYLKDSFALYVSGGYVRMQVPEGHVTGGIASQFFYADRFSVESRISFGSHYLHSPVTALAGMIVYEAAAVYWLITGKAVPRFIVLLFAESYSYHFRLSPHSSIAPYVSPLSFDMEIPADTNPQPHYALASSAGLRFNVFADTRLAFNLFSEYKYDYINREFYPEFGLGLGIFFEPKLYR